MGEQSPTHPSAELLEAYRSLDMDLSAPGGSLGTRMGIELIEISAERVVGTMPVEGNTQPYGLLHGGASAVLAETLGSVGSAGHAHPDKLSGGIEIKATHHRSATPGPRTRTGAALHPRPTTAT